MLQNYQARITKKELLAGQTFLFRFQITGNQKLEIIPGQYLMLNIAPLLTRLYSISGTKDNNELEIIVDVAPQGPGSQYLSKLKEGDLISFKAPLGFFTLKKTPQPKIFLATGVGITPMKAMISQLVMENNQTPCWLFWGLRQKTDGYLFDYWEKLQKENLRFQYYFCLSQESNLALPFVSGHVQENLSKFVNKEIITQAEYYLCGRQKVIMALKNYLTDELQIPEAQIFQERFT